MLIAVILPKIGLQIGNHSWPSSGPGGCQNGQPAAVNIHPLPPNTESKVETQSSQRPFKDSPPSKASHPRNLTSAKHMQAAHTAQQQQQLLFLWHINSMSATPTPSHTLLPLHRRSLLEICDSSEGGAKITAGKVLPCALGDLHDHTSWKTSTPRNRRTLQNNWAAAGTSCPLCGWAAPRACST